MILHALADYYRRKQADPDPAQRLPAYGFEEKEIPFILEIDAAGRPVQILDTRSGEGKKKTAQRFLVPKAVKKTSGVATDLAFEAVQEVGLDAGLVDNKVCAIDDTWSGLRLVIRRELR